MEEPSTKHIAAGEAYDLDGHVKMQCTLRCCLYLSRASFSALLSRSAFSSSLLCGFLPSAFLSSSLSLFLTPLPQLSLFSASFSTYNALFSRSMKTASPQSILVLLRLPIYVCLSHTHTRRHTRAHTKHLSMEIEIMIMYPSVCIKVLPLQKKAGRHEMQT